MPITKKPGSKKQFVLKSPNTGKTLATGSKGKVEQRAKDIAYFRSQKKK